MRADGQKRKESDMYTSINGIELTLNDLHSQIVEITDLAQGIHKALLMAREGGEEEAAMLSIATHSVFTLHTLALEICPDSQSLAAESEQ